MLLYTINIVTLAQKILINIYLSSYGESTIYMCISVYGYIIKAALFPGAVHNQSHNPPAIPFHVGLHVFFNAVSKY